MNRKSLLFLTTQLPYPPTSGGTIKTFKTLAFLSAHYDVYYASFLKGDEYLHEADFKRQMWHIQKFITFPFEKPRSAVNLLKSYVHQMPLNVYRNYHPLFQQQVQSLSENADAIFIDHLEMFQYVPENFTGKIFFHEHNAEFMLWKRYAETFPKGIKQRLVKKEAARIKKRELLYCQKADVVFAAPNDIEVLASEGVERTKMFPTLHLGNDALLSLPDLKFEETPVNVLFIGTLSWEANKRGLIWFINTVWPLVMEKIPESRFIIIGKGADSELLKVAEKQPNIELKGFVHDIAEVFSYARIMVSPLIFGSGIKVKNIDALYRGIPLVTTPVGAEGIDLKDGENCLIAGSSTVFAQKVIELLTKKNLWQAISQAARRLGEEKYRWETNLSTMKKVIDRYL